MSIKNPLALYMRAETSENSVDCGLLRLFGADMIDCGCSELFLHVIKKIGNKAIAMNLLLGPVAFFIELIKNNIHLS